MSSLKLRTTVANDIKPTTTGVAVRTSYAAWWLKNPPKPWAQKQTHHQRHVNNQQHQQQQQRRKQSFSQDMGNLFRNISLHGYSKLTDPELTLFEKLIWLSFHVTSMVTLCIVLSYTWEQFVAQYFVINLHDPLYPVVHVPFPAVSICSNNRISYRAALEYAKELQVKDTQKRSVDFFLRNIKLFSSLHIRSLKFDRDSHEYDAIDVDKFIEFQSFLQTYDIMPNQTFFNTQRVMTRLAPKCTDFLIQCLLAGVEIDCFGPQAFEPSFTTYGLCCAFNLNNSYNHRSKENSFVLPDLGLTVVLNTSKADDFNNILNIDGYAVFIHGSSNYPDISSGSSVEVFPTVNEESIVAIKARLIDSDDNLRSFSPKSRKCYFDDEAPQPELMVRNNYTFANCITLCRIHSILALCNCVPFYMPVQLADRSKDKIYCTLDHINCLLNYNFKWRNVLTVRQTLPELEREKEESLLCPNCLISCDDVQYQPSMMSLPLDRFRSSLNYKHLEDEGRNLKDISVLRVHFRFPYSEHYRRVIGNTWYEVLSTVGNILSIFIGFSIIAIFEVLYFIVKYFLIAAKKFIAQNRKRHRKHTTKCREDKFETELYICP